MALRMGAENKRQVYLLAGLLIVLVGALAYNMKSFFGGSSAPAPAPVPQPAALRSPAQSAGPAAQKLTNAGLDPTLHFDRLALTEDVTYEGKGRNIFAGGPALTPAAVEKPIKSARITPPAPPPIPEAPKPPAINLKYFGYAQGKDKSMRAFFVQGDNIFVARPGDVVDHRYKVGPIQANSAQVTDLGYNNTQTLPLQTAR